MSEHYLKNQYGPIYTLLYKTPSQSKSETINRKKELVKFITRNPHLVFRTGNKDTIYKFDQAFQKYRNRIYHPKTIQKYESAKRESKVMKEGLMAKPYLTRLAFSLPFPQLMAISEIPTFKDIMEKSNFWEKKREQLIEEYNIDFEGIIGSISPRYIVVIAMGIRFLLPCVLPLAEYNTKSFKEIYGYEFLDLSKCSASLVEPLSHLLPWLVNLRSLTINGSQIGDLENGLSIIPSKITHLEIIGRRSVKHIPENLLTNLQNLRYFKISRCDLDTLPGRLFRGLTGLGKLDLSNNKLKTLPPNIFQGLIYLTSLNISKNNLTTLPPNIFKPLTNLGWLYLDNKLHVNFTGSMVKDTLTTQIKIVW